MEKEFLLLEKFALQTFRAKLKQLDIVNDYLETNIKLNGEYYKIRIEGEPDLVGEFKWMLSASIKLRAFHAMN